jgi:hypothetical protein
MRLSFLNCQVSISKRNADINLVKSVSDHNTGPYQCSAIPPDDTLDNVDQGSLGTGSEQTTDEVLLTNPSEVKPQPIGQKSPTLPS